MAGSTMCFEVDHLQVQGPWSVAADEVEKAWSGCQGRAAGSRSGMGWYSDRSAVWSRRSQDGMGWNGMEWNEGGRRQVGRYALCCEARETTLAASLSNSGHG